MFLHYSSEKKMNFQRRSHIISHIASYLNTLISLHYMRVTMRKPTYCIAPKKECCRSLLTVSQHSLFLFVMIYFCNDLLHHFLEIRGRVFAPWTGKISWKFFSLINVTAYRTTPYRLAGRGFFLRFRLDGGLVVRIGC